MSYRNLEEVFTALYGKVPKDFLSGYMSMLKSGNAAALSQQKADLAYGRAVLEAAKKEDKKFADKLITEYTKIAGPTALFARRERREKELNKRLGELEKEQKELGKIRAGYRDMSDADQAFIADAASILKGSPIEFFRQAYAVDPIG